jgi:uncharacterized protein YggL (DUF469 family)
LFGNTWGDAEVNPAPYIDTYFSVVTETIFDYPYTFRTEKIWKPMIMEHPFVAAANRGYYKDLHSAGFQTFGHLIDESFDQIDDPRDRADRIVDTVADICYNGAASFLEAADLFVNTTINNFANTMLVNVQNFQNVWPNTSMNDLEFKQQVLDPLSPSFCAAKWYNATIWLGSGQTTSCHHPPAHLIDADKVNNNSRLLHNTDQKKEDRRNMVLGTP